MLPQRNTKSQVSSAENNVRRRLRNFSALTGYPIQNLKFLRKIGPPLQYTTVPVRGSEVFAHRLPLDALEDELFWFFQRAGDIYEIRLMLRPSGLANRGYAFVRYCSPHQAQTAIETLNKEEFRSHLKIVLEASIENNRLFLSGVPLDKTRAEIFDELLRVGVQGVVDVIMYRGYKKTHKNRGFVFIEFQTHEEAAAAKREFSVMLRLWNLSVILDWAEPMRHVDSAVMAKVTRVFVRNLDIHLKKEKLIETLKQMLDFTTVQKVYKHMDYSFIHFFTREMAEKGLKKLQEYFCNSDVEVTWSKPPEAAKNRHLLPPRLQNKTKNNRTKSAKNTNNKVDVKFQNIDSQQTSKDEKDDNNHNYGKLEELMKNSLWSNESRDCTDNCNKNENNITPWELWKHDVDWFNYCVGNKHKNREKLTEGCTILTEPRYIHGHSNEEDQNEVQSWSLKDDHIEDEIGCRLLYQNSAKERRDTNSVQDIGTSSLREAVNQPFNLRLHLDLYERRGNKHNAS